MDLNNKQSGVTLLLAILVLSAILAISFSISTILFIEVRSSGDLLRTEEALYAAQGVSEEVLFGVKHKVANFQPTSGAYTTQTSDGRVTLTSTSSLLSDMQVSDTVPLSANSLALGKRYDLFDASAENPSVAGSSYGRIKVTYKDTGNGNNLHVFLCQFDPNATPSVYDIMPVCSDAGYNSYWLAGGRDIVLNTLPGHVSVFDTSALNPAMQQELVLYNEGNDPTSSTIYVQIEAFGPDFTTPKGMPNYYNTTVNINAANSGVNRKVRTIIPNN